MAADVKKYTTHDELDALGTKLSSRDGDALSADFGGCVFSALEAVKGTLLFQMDIGAESAARKVAAVSVGHGDSREYALVILQNGAEQVRVERATESDDPLAAVATSYAAVIDLLDLAA